MTVVILHTDWNDAFTPNEPDIATIFIYLPVQYHRTSNSVWHFQIGKWKMRPVVNFMNIPRFSQPKMTLPSEWKLILPLDLPGAIRFRIDLKKRTLIGGPWTTVFSEGAKIEKTDYAKMLATNAKKKGIILNWASKSSHISPFSNIIYNRVGRRSIEKSEEFQKDWSMHNQSAHCFNYSFLDKQVTDQFIQNDPTISRFRIPTDFLPWRNRLPNIRDTVVSSLQHQDVHFFKPIEGSGGHGIWRITYSNRADSMLTLESSTQKRHMHQNDFLQWMVNKLKLKAYIWQRGITLATHGNQRFDVRALVQKNKHGQWTVSSLVVRIAPYHAWLCNQQQGAIVQPANSICDESLISKLKKVALLTATSFQRQISWPYPPGEFGIDLFVDQNEMIWIAEVNSKPSKQFLKTKSDGKIPKSIELMTDYFIYVHERQKE